LHVAAAISLLGGAALADEAGQSCKTSHNLVGACFSIHGRLFVFDPAPTIRIAWDGTDRVLGVLDRQSSAAGPELVPSAVSALLAAAPSTTEIDGDYLVCPFDRTHLGRMQAVCIQAASHLIARRR
jgi:hypothetical protein